MRVRLRRSSRQLFPEEDFALRVMRIRSHSPASLHEHDFHELVVVLGGAARHVTSEGHYPISAGDVFLIRGDMAHGYEETNRLMIVNILFDPAGLGLPTDDLRRLPGYHVLFRLEPLLRRQHGFRSRLRLATDQLAEAAGLITRLENELVGRPPGYRFMARAHLMHLIGFLSRSYADAPAEAAERRSLLALAGVLSFIERHYAEEITVDRLAGMAAMSESSLMRSFRKVTGRSPIDYVIALRVAKAAELLRRTDLAVTEIAFRCGFNDSNYFSRQFRKTMGRSPREYRKQQAAGGPA
jgi:AraC-like DNA-binding protein/quercetin dioxygenase-like cupin family protein